MAVKSAKKVVTHKNYIAISGMLSEDAETKTTLKGSVHHFLISTFMNLISTGDRIDVPCVCSHHDDLGSLLIKDCEVSGQGYLGEDSLGRGTVVITSISLMEHGVMAQFKLPVLEDF